MNTTQRNQILTRYQVHADRFEAIAASRPAVPPLTIDHSPEESRSPLTVRELEVLQLMSVGLANRDIATKLVVSIETVKSHVRSILAKLHTVSRAHAVAVGFRSGLVT